MTPAQTLPLLALRDLVVFPGTVAPIFIGREKSVNALNIAKNMGEGFHILLATQKNHGIEEPNIEDLYNVGVLAKIIQTVRLPNNNIKLLIEATERVKLSNIVDDQTFLADYVILPDYKISNISELEKSLEHALNIFKEYAQFQKKVPTEILKSLNEQKNPSYIANILATHLISKIDIKQELLEELDVQKRIDSIISSFSSHVYQVNAEQDLQKEVKKQIEKTQRNYYLNEQLKAIHKELDEGEDKSDFYEIEQKIKNLKLSKEAKEKAQSELKKLRSMNQMSAESSVVRNYLDNLLGMPWGQYDKSKININDAQKVLDHDHFGLEKVKERIVEYLSVLQRSKKMKGPILCFIGPPGVGKTSLVKSIAEALGRKYIKFALGGVRDEAEIRGHRRTYLGSMPGKIINSIKKVKISNPVILLDEIDKMGSDFRGDPASALLEVLDPEQNSHFVDHYLEVEYDLSNVIFVATANSYSNLPRPLLDRMEIIDIAGYVEQEKLQIAKDYLISKQLKIHAMQDNELVITDATILEIIRYYTKESGVRALERMIGALTRKVLKKILSDKNIVAVTIEPENLEEYLGARKYRFGLMDEQDQIGATTGLAYTEVGGDLLTIEALSFPGKGEVKTTGKLGEVMKESAQAAYSCFRTRAAKLGLDYEKYKDLDIHLHVPEGAVPKDGPSAGTAIFTTIVSLMTNVPVKKTIAMTGEITLRGKVLPIGGLKEKLLAACRGGIKTVLIPVDNVKDLKDIPIEIKNKLEILPVSNIDEVLKNALVR